MRDARLMIQPRHGIRYLRYFDVYVERRESGGLILLSDGVNNSPY